MAHLLTIGTEITSGEVVNSNAAWMSIALESLGFRVHSHLSVRDQKDEILSALNSFREYPLIFVSGGLGPTSDDVTRACVAEHCGQSLEFDQTVWNALEAAYQARGLILREAHRHQCWFPRDSVRLKNPVGTALGFWVKSDARNIFVLPGPPRELQAMWKLEVEPPLKAIKPSQNKEWVRWTCLGAPESEIAELVEQVIAGLDIEVGYRAQVPYVKVKVFVDPFRQRDVVEKLDAALKAHLVGRGFEDLAEEFLTLWPETLLSVSDAVTDTVLIQRLLSARKSLRERNLHAPQLKFTQEIGRNEGFGLSVRMTGEEFFTELVWSQGQVKGKKTLPYKVKLDSERGRRSAAEWILWQAVSALSASSSQSRT